MLQVIPSYYTTSSKKSLFISAKTFEKNIVRKEYYIARYEDTMRFLSNCRYHIILIGDIKQLLHKLDNFCFDYQHLDWLYTLFKYRFSGKIVVKSGQPFDIVQRAVHFNHRNRGVDWMRSIAKKRPLWKTWRKNSCWAPSRKPKRRKLVNQSLQTELNELKRLIRARTGKNCWLFPRWLWYLY